ncbi:hypothetical protein HMPREF7215_2787 [Pyramidobacter piscolens W5455]|uniref:DUF2190 family protein n=1 Tax=Pyramidobacter piscolens W5455 TaxID=352165 RepID=A0ABP2HRW2_9BACT|nr:MULTISPECIES: DUF2190 family protein [Pyramidobacter]EFB89916.1 hypothetical protein HMPREF7215_2787 [Pyramidobacter piscolens W5455]MCI6259534.1 DUF2190 family protein [Pyramidobacter sp.]MDY2647905.1 DUF2190 family protein [Pyramidobacter porci]
MPMTKPIQIGNAITYVNAGEAAIAARDVVALANMCGIAQTGIAPGEAGTLILAGVHEVPAATGAAFAVGQIVYWDASGKKAAAAGTVPLGVVVEPKASSAATAKVRIGVALPGA